MIIHQKVLVQLIFKLKKQSSNKSKLFEFLSKKKRKVQRMKKILEVFKHMNIHCTHKITHNHCKTCNYMLSLIKHAII